MDLPILNMQKLNVSPPTVTTQGFFSFLDPPEIALKNASCVDSPSVDDFWASWKGLGNLQFRHHNNTLTKAQERSLTTRSWEVGLF